MLTALALAAPLLQLPIACQPGRTCWIQKYVDVMPGPDRRDYRCGTITMDGHDGVDFRIGGFAEMRQGVAVLAAAAGTVLRARDGVQDISAKERAVQRQQAGNGVVIDHGDGWETQYSHLRQGSVRVRPGQKVGPGTILGHVGLSGQTEYPHLHFSIRFRGATVDPFVGSAATTCGSASAVALWNDAAARALTYRRGDLVRFGLTTAPRPSPVVEPLPFPTRSTPIVAVAELVAPDPRQTYKLELLGPGGTPLVNRLASPDRPYLSWSLHWGLKAPAGGWRPGRYTARLSARSDDRPVTETSVTID